MIAFAITLVLVAFFLGAPLFAALGIGSALICVFEWQLPIQNLGALMFARINRWILLAVPLFILAGNLMMAGGIAERILRFIRSWVGHFPGGLLIATVLFCTLFASLTGSPTAAIAAIGPIMIPEMRKRGYSPEVAGGILVSGSQLGNIIPPSTTFIILSSLMEIPAATLFMAGVGPGLLISVLLITIGTFVCIRQGFRKEPPASWKTRWTSSIYAIPGIFIAVVVLGGIYGGFMTPTEAAAVAGIYCVILGWLVYRGFTLKSFWNAFVTTARRTGMIYVLLVGVGLFGYTISRLGVPQTITSFMIAYKVSPTMFVLIFMVSFVALGFVMPPITTMLIMVPLLMPAFLAYQLTLIWLAVLFVVNVDLGGMTPPMAYMIYVTAGITGIPAERIIRGVIPFALVFLVVIITLVFLPEIALWLPRTMGLFIA